MKSRRGAGVAAIALLLILGCSNRAQPAGKLLTPSAQAATSQPTANPTTTAVPASPTAVPLAPAAATSPAADAAGSPGSDPFALVSLDSLLGYLDGLTAIQPYSGWRNSATEGERQALDYVAEKLGGLTYLRGLGLDLERQTFRVPIGVEIWDTRLELKVGGEGKLVPVNGLRGNRDDVGKALRFDSDGKLNDSTRNPVTAQGQALVVRTAQGLDGLDAAAVRGKLLFADYALVDYSIQPQQAAGAAATRLIGKQPAGILFVTRNSNKQGESHGAFVGDGGVFQTLDVNTTPPILYVRGEDLAQAGIMSLDDLAKVESARLTWDADVFAPATSGNLIARIPGVDSSHAVILSAHVDSPNSPGAMDDGSGSAVLLEVARVLDSARLRPPVDLYLAWFGSEELHLFGSYTFVATHQELLDRTLAMLQVDCLTRPLDGIDAYLNLVAWSYGRHGDSQLAWPTYLIGAAGKHGVRARSTNYYGVESDNSGFAGFDVPNANLIFENRPEMEKGTSIHHSAHLHDPYDTVAVAREVGDILQQMARVALSAALDTPRDAPALRHAPKPDRRAVFVASHTEAVHLGPATFTDLGMALAMNGFDVDLVPYGQAVTPRDLAGANMVVALPVVDYPSPDGDVGVYDEAWTPAEVAALEGYVAGGGFLVITNTGRRFKWAAAPLDANEDWGDMNALAERFGVSYQTGALAERRATVQSDSPLGTGVQSLWLIEGNGVPFTLAAGDVLARAGDQPAVALVRHGPAGGQVLVLADVGILAADWSGPDNLPFWNNLARYVRQQ